MTPQSPRACLKVRPRAGRSVPRRKDPVRSEHNDCPQLPIPLVRPSAGLSGPGSQYVLSKSPWRRAFCADRKWRAKHYSAITRLVFRETKRFSQSSKPAKPGYGSTKGAKTSRNAATWSNISLNGNHKAQQGGLISWINFKNGKNQILVCF